MPQNTGLVTVLFCRQCFFAVLVLGSHSFSIMYFVVAFHDKDDDMVIVPDSGCYGTDEDNFEVFWLPYQDPAKLNNLVEKMLLW